MKHTLWLVALALLFSACRKGKIQPDLPVPDTHPQMRYTDLGDTRMAFNQSKKIDLDGDGSNDFLFYTLLVGDPLLQQDKKQFYVTSGIKRNLLNDANGESPILQKNETISSYQPGYTWWEISNLLLAEKIISLSGSWWQGNWKDVSHRYLPVQLETEGGVYNGWIEVSFSTNEEKLILHRAAISNEAGKTIKAGW